MPSLCYLDRWRRLRLEVPLGIELPALPGIIDLEREGRLAVATSNAFVPDLASTYESTGARVQRIENMTLEELHRQRRTQPRRGGNMNPVIGYLVLKDWRLNRLPILLTLVVGVVALLLTQFAVETPPVLGGVWFFVALCVLAGMLPVTAILNECKKQTLAFVVTLPISSVQYSTAKIVSLWAMFLLPWLTLLISALMLIEMRHIMPHGVIPLFILAMPPFLGFCVISAAALVGESEGWLMAASLVCNSSYWFIWYLLDRIPFLRAGGLVPWLFGARPRERSCQAKSG